MAEKQMNVTTGQASSDKWGYSVEEVAEILGVSKRSIYSLCSQNAFKAVRVGTNRRAVDKFIQQIQKTPPVNTSYRYTKTEL